MNDTITLNLHDLKKHEQIVNLLRIMQNGYRKFDNVTRGGTLNHEVTLYDDSSKYMEKFIYRSSLQASSHYKVIFMVNIFKDLIQFSFSIPKYFYGHNIAQNVLNVNEVNFSMLDSSIDYAIDNGFERLNRYIYQFFDNEFPGVKIDYSHLELKRLDFCYNQIFKSKSDAFEYLELQRQLKKKNLRDDTTKSNNYSTSIMYYNKDYSVKIYHKGSEFAKNDKYELNQINRSSNIKFDTEYLQEISDKILRYEITIRPSYMSYIFNQKLFRKDSKQFQTWKSLYNKIKSKNKSLENKKFFDDRDKAQMFESLFLLFKNKTDKDTGLKLFEYLHQYFYKQKNKTEITLIQATRLMNKFYLEFDVLIHTKRKFLFLLNKEDRQMFNHDNFTNINKFETFKIVPFTKDLYTLMNNKLIEFIKDMEVEQKKSLSHYLKEIDSYNDSIDKLKNQQKHIASPYKIKSETKIDKPKLAMILCSLENYDLKQLKNIVNLSKSTYFRYQAQLKKIGFTKHTVDKCSIAVPEFSFRDYYIETMLNSKKMFINNFMLIKTINKTF